MSCDADFQKRPRSYPNECVYNTKYENTIFFYSSRKQCLPKEQGKSEGFDNCDRPSNLTQIGLESSIFQPVWPRNLMDDPEK